MKTRIEELIEDMDIELLIPHNDMTVGLLKYYKGKFEEIKQNHLTPIEALKASPKWVKALAMTSGGKWFQYSGTPVPHRDCFYLSNTDKLGRLQKQLRLNIHYEGDWKDSLITREDIE